MIPPKNLRIEFEPYPHLRDDDGCILARDYIHADKLKFIFEAVAEKLAREPATVKNCLTVQERALGEVQRQPEG
jgi:hypothetical protein